MKSIAMAAVLSAILPTYAFAASGNSANAGGVAGGTVISPLVLTHAAGSSLNFGKLIVSSSGTVVVTATGVGSATGGVAFAPGSVNAADSFSVTGDPSRSYSITTTGGNVTAGAVSMAFTTTPSTAQATLGATGTGTFTVGSTLTVGSGAVAGSYTGSYTATVNYN